MDPRLSELFSLQQKLMAILGVEKDDGDRKQSLTLRNVILGVISEAIEVGDLICTQTKPWKDDVPLDVDHYEEEVVDILFMWMELCILSDMNPQKIHDIYLKKYGRNMERFVTACKDPTDPRLPDAVLEAAKVRANFV